MMMMRLGMKSHFLKRCSLSERLKKVGKIIYFSNYLSHLTLQNIQQWSNHGFFTSILMKMEFESRSDHHNIIQKNAYWKSQTSIMVALTVNIIALTDIGQAAATSYSVLQKPQSHLGQPWQLIFWRSLSNHYQPTLIIIRAKKLAICKSLWGFTNSKKVPLIIYVTKMISEV